MKNKNLKYIISGVILMLLGILIYNKEIKPLPGKATVLGNDGRHIRNTLLGGAIFILGISLLGRIILDPIK